MCEEVQKDTVSVVHLDLYKAQHCPLIRYHAFLGYLFFASILQDERKLQMLIAARTAYEHYADIKSRQSKGTDIFKLEDVA
jgi:hypothetical protein